MTSSRSEKIRHPTHAQVIDPRKHLSLLTFTKVKVQILVNPQKLLHYVQGYNS
jgi:hypothetical protein